MSAEVGQRPLVSVVIPFLNAEAFILEAVQSVFEQTYENWELIFVDDGSSDSTAALALQYVQRDPRRIVFLEHPGHRNRGISASRNLAVSQARGKYIAPLDADDLWMPWKLEKQVAILESHPEAGMVYGKTLRWHDRRTDPEGLQPDQVTELGIEVDRVYPPRSLSTLLYPLGSAPSPSMSNWLMLRSLIESLGGFEESFHGIYGLYEDQAFLSKVYLDGTVFVSGENYWDRIRVRTDSDQVVKATHYHTVLRFFVNWLESYLKRLDVTDAPIWAALDHARQMARRQWAFRTGGTNRARVVFPDEHPDAVRILIERVTSDIVWDIQILRRGLKLQSGHRYRLTVEARADAGRILPVGVGLAHEPWNGLGLYQEFEITSQWNCYEAEFVATADERDARVYFDLGRTNISVEIASVRLVHLPDETPVEPCSGEVLPNERAPAPPETLAPRRTYN